MARPTLETISLRRVQLEPLAVDHAAEMTDVLAEPSLYRFTGGRPPTFAQLQQRYTLQIVGHSADGMQWWFNWVVVMTDPRCPVGYVQATVERCDDVLTASLAWVIAPQFQGRGYASEAVTGMMQWLESAGISRFVADIHDNHAASAAIARKQGLRPTAQMIDGEVRWRSTEK